MLQTPRATRGMVLARHHLAAQAGLSVLREGGNAIQAMIAAAAAIAVVCPHIKALDRDNFWLVNGGRRRAQRPDGVKRAAGDAWGGGDVELYGAGATPFRVFT